MNQRVEKHQPVNPALIFGGKLVDVWVLKEVEGLTQPFTGYVAYNDTAQIIVDMGGSYAWLPKSLVASIITRPEGAKTDES